MKIIPAIDLLDSKVVRFDSGVIMKRSKVYSDEPRKGSLPEFSKQQ